MKLRQIKNFTENYFKIRNLRTKTRNKEIVFYRYVAFYLAKNYTKKSLEEIGRVIGDKDHATVLHGLKYIEKYQTEKTHTGRFLYEEEAQTIRDVEQAFNDRIIKAEDRYKMKELNKKLSLIIEKARKKNDNEVTDKLNKELDEILLKLKK